jgi:hypothetical protein
MLVDGPSRLSFLFLLQQRVGFDSSRLINDIEDCVAVVAMFNSKWFLRLIENKPDYACKKYVTESSNQIPSPLHLQIENLLFNVLLDGVLWRNFEEGKNGDSCVSHYE